MMPDCEITSLRCCPIAWRASIRIFVDDRTMSEGLVHPVHRQRMRMMKKSEQDGIQGPVMIKVKNL
jgi:hypothetical protein